MVGGLARALPARKVTLAAVVAAVVVALLVLGLTRPWSQEKAVEEVAPPAPGDRVLQSVHLAMQPDGSLTGIDDSVVIARAQGGAAETLSTTYDPSAVVDQLPVRVLTSYRTDTGTGTDLRDLRGHTGRVTIDLRVENLTVRPQQLTYDAAGRSRTSTAMVGAPLTVVASASLPGTDPSTVVTADPATARADRDPDTTNGVLSQSADSTTQVQWATILAPPQLDAAATLRLVVDARDFAPPTIDLNVQPGLVTDPSLGALVDAAFTPQSSRELELQTRTIKLIGDVNRVLVRADDTISDLRGTLDTTSKTLGTKTVSALRSSTEDVTTSMKASSAGLDALGDDLSASLGSTGSATLATMAQTVSQLDQVLGDTSTERAPARTTGEGCEQQVAGPRPGTSVYASLQQVAGQLDGYASATDACKVALQQAILARIGPAEPTDEACTTPSVTCSLAGVESTFADIADTFVADGQLALAGLGPDGLEPISTSLATLVTQLGKAGDDADALLDDDAAEPTEPTDPTEPADPADPADPTDEDAPPAPDEPAADAPTFASVARRLATATDTLTTLTAALDATHRDALAGATQAASLQTQNAELGTRLCTLVGDGTRPGTLSAAQVEELRAYLTDRSCPAPDGSTTALTPPEGYDAAMGTRLAGQSGTFTKVAAATDTDPGATGTGPLPRLRAQIAATRTDLEQLADASEQQDARYEERVAALRTSLATATATATELTTTVGGVAKGYTEARAELAAALQKAGDDAKAQVSTSVDAEIRRIADQGQTDSDQVGTMFERSAAGLSGTADRITADGAKAVQEQHEALDQTATGAEQTLSAGTERALTQVSRDITSSTRDLDATRALLTRDLGNVLLDLGDRKVRGSGVLGALATSAAAAGSADYQLGLASDQGSAYAAVRARDVDGIMLRQAQAEAALERQAQLAPFVRTLPATVSHRTVYVFHLDGGR